MSRHKTLIGIPTLRRYAPFWDSLKEFKSHLEEMHDVQEYVVYDESVVNARNKIAQKFLETDCDFLLFLDDDHEGHTIDMFRSILMPLLEYGEVMCGIKCYKTIFPYTPTTLCYSGVDEKKLGIEIGQGKYIPIDLKKGYAQVDLIGFGMTLLSKEAFKIIDQPYFFVEGHTKEDNYFCDKLVKAQRRPVACFNHTLSHQGIGYREAHELREKGVQEIREKYPDVKVIVS